MRGLSIIEWLLIFLTMALMIPVTKILADVKHNIKLRSRRVLWYVIIGYIGLNGIRIFLAAIRLLSTDIALLLNLTMNIGLVIYLIGYLHKTYLINAFAEFQGDTSKAVFWDIELMIEQVIREGKVEFGGAVGTLIKDGLGFVKIRFVFSKKSDYGAHFHYRDEDIEVIEGIVYVNGVKYAKNKKVRIGELMLHSFATESKTVIITTLTKTK